MEEQVKEKVKSVFGKNADKYVTSEIHAKGDDLPLLAEWPQPEKTWTVLDIATGGGHVSKALAPHMGTVISTDLTEEMLENTAKHLRAEFDNILYVVADAESLPFLAGSFDSVVCRIAPHHFPHPEKFIQETARVLKPGGKFILIDNVAPENSELAVFMNTTEKLRDMEPFALFVQSGMAPVGSGKFIGGDSVAGPQKNVQIPDLGKATAESEEQIERVEQHLLGADATAMDYFQIDIQNGQVQTFIIDEWMVMFQK